MCCGLFVIVQDGSASTSRKIFVGRCSEDLTTDDLRSFFANYGEVQDVYIPRPFRGFAFVTFADPVIAQSLLGEDLMIRGTSVHVSSATPKQGNESGRPGLGSGIFKGPSVGSSNLGRYGQLQQQQQRIGMKQDVIANMGVFSEAVISAAQTALAQQGWGSFIDAVMPSKGGPGGKQGANGGYGGWE
jgi:TAR DNA-binding protein 43